MSLKQKLRILLQNSTDFDDYEKKITSERFSIKQLGDFHEILCKWYFNFHKKHYNILCYISYINLTEKKKQFLEKFNLPSKDKGTDAVIVHTDRTFSLVQVKYRSKDEKHRREVFNGLAIDAFNCKRPIKNLYLFSNCSNVSEEGFEYDKSKFKFILYDAMKDINWKLFRDSIPVRNSTKKTFNKVIKYRKWQKNAIDFTHMELDDTNENKLSVIAPCGAGKTLYAFGAIKKMFKEDFKILIITPTLQLLSQWYECLATYFEEDVNFLCVGSDMELKEENSRFDITTDENSIKKILKINNKKLVIISTYKSLERVQNSCIKTKFKFDLSFADEAHGTATSSKKDSYYSMITKKDFPTKFKIYMTATPRIFKGKMTEEVISMDNREIYGYQYRYSVRQAISDNIISDYKIILGVCEENIKEGFPDSQRYDVYAKLLLHCIKKYELKRILVASSSHIGSKKLYDTFSEMYKRDKSLDHNLILMPPRCNSSKKNEAIAKITRSNGIIFNVKVFNLGTDIPQLDTVFFNGDKNSIIDIVQTSMRCMRKHPDKEIAYVIVPAFLGEDIKVENGDYPTVRNTLNAMGDQDELLREEVLLKSKNAFNGKRGIKSSKDRVLIEGISEVNEINLESIGDRLFNSLGEGENPLLKFSMLVDIYKETENLVEAKFITKEGFQAGKFQDHLFGALSGRKMVYEGYSNYFRETLKSLKVWKTIEKRIKNVQENRKVGKISIPEKFKMLTDLYIETGKLLKSKFTTLKGMKLGSFQDTLFGALSGRNGKYEKYLECFRKTLENLKVWKEIEKRIEDMRENRRIEKLTVLERFKLLLDIYIKTEKLVKSGLIIEGIKLGNFQSNLLGALSGINKRYKEYLNYFRKELEKLKVWSEIEERINDSQKIKKIVKFTVLERFKMLIDIYVKSEKLVSQSFVTESGIKLGSFQDNLLGALSGRTKGYKGHLNSFREILKKLKVWEEFEKRIKNAQEKIK